MPNEHPSKRGLIYARVSSEEQKKSGHSIPSQIRLLEEKMKADGVVLAHEPIVDTESGTTPEREGLKQLWKFAKSGGVDFVYTYDLDRLGRDVAETPHLMYKLKRETGVIVRAIDREYNFGDPTDFLLAVLQSYPGHIESRKIGERTRRGKIEKFRSGKWVGPVPFAYRRSSSGELEKVREFEQIVRKIFETYRQQNDVTQTTRLINEIYSKTIGELSADQVRRILVRSIYSGRPRYGKTEISTPQLSMVPADLFENVQLLLEKKARKSKAKKERKPKSLLDDLVLDYDTGSLTGILKWLKPHCPRCGTEMQGNGSKLSHVVEGARLPNFRCKCGYQRTIPNDDEFERLRTALSCPRCRYLHFDATARLDGFAEYSCKRCGFSFMFRPELSRERLTANDNSKHILERDSLVSRISEQYAASLESIRRLVRRLAKSGFSLEPLAFEYLKKVNALDVETIGDSIVENLNGRVIPGGVITRQLLMEVLSPPLASTTECPKIMSDNN